MRRYAQETTVDANRSRAEIERLLSNYGADQFLYGWDNGAAVIGFRHANRTIRFHLPDADRNDVSKTETGRTRKNSQVELALTQERRRRWRAWPAKTPRA